MNKKGETMIKIMKEFKVLSAVNKTANQNKDLAGVKDAKGALKKTRQDEIADTMLKTENTFEQTACMIIKKPCQTHSLSSALKKVKIPYLSEGLKKKEPTPKQGKHPNSAAKEGMLSRRAKEGTLSTRAKEGTLLTRATKERTLPNSAVKQTFKDWMKDFFLLRHDTALLDTIPPRRVYPDNLPSNDVDAALFLMKQNYTDGIK